MTTPAYFLHIPKAAGTSVHAALTALLGPGRSTPPLLWDHIVLDPSVIGPETQLVTGHFGGFLPLWWQRWPVMFTVVRDPIARALSHINHVQRSVGHPLHERALGLGVEAYCADPVLRMTVENLQSRYLASLQVARALLRPPSDAMTARSLGFEQSLYALDRNEGLAAAAMAAIDDVDAVGLSHELEVSLARFARLLGRAVAPATPVLNTAAQGQHHLDALASRELDALRSCNEVDELVFRHACRRFERQSDRDGGPEAAASERSAPSEARVGAAG